MGSFVKLLSASGRAECGRQFNGGACGAGGRRFGQSRERARSAAGGTQRIHVWCDFLPAQRRWADHPHIGQIEQHTV